jgi:hypothetical protein
MLVGLAPGPSFAQESFADRVVAKYATLETYCDRIHSLDRRISTEVRRCFTRDGRQKRIAQYGPQHWHNTRMMWGDTDNEYYWLRSGDGTTRIYNERAARDRRMGGLPEGLTARALHTYLRYVGTEDAVREYLTGMAVVGVDAGTTILERRRTSRDGSVEIVNRVWVRDADALIVRGEERWYGDAIYDGDVVWSAELTGVRRRAGCHRMEQLCPKKSGCAG